LSFVADRLALSAEQTLQDEGALDPTTKHADSVTADPVETRYGGAVDVKRAADMYTQGWTVRQIGAELGVPWTAVSHQLRRAGVTMRRGGPSAHHASTQTDP
jgi:hypothetical protein